MRAGPSTGHPDVTTGTPGGFVRRPGTPGLLLLSNNHVLAVGGAAQAGDPALQPGVTAIGLNCQDAEYVVRVDLTEVGAGARVPRHVDGVRVVTHVIGAVRAL